MYKSGLECLQEELISRGIHPTTAQSRAIAVAVDIIANAGHENLDLWETKKRQGEIVAAAQNNVIKSEQRLKDIEAKIKKEEQTLQDVSRKFEPMQEYIDAFYEALEECETDEGRDALKRAQLFANSVDIETKYDNTAFIVGLSAILSSGRVPAIQTLKKINKRLPIPEEHPIWVDNFIY